MTPIALRALTAAVLAAGLGLPTGAQAAVAPTVSTAPGRIVFPVDDGSVLNNVDAGGASLATALPDGSTLMFGSGAAGPGVLYAAKISMSGALDRSFGTGGVTSFPAPSGASFASRQVLRQSDGKLLLVSSAQPVAGRFTPGQLQVTRMNADATLDRSYGVDGTATTGVGQAAGATAAALTPDGAVVLTGSTGEVQPPPAARHLQWAVTRLTPTGAVDAGFGSGGIATITTAASTTGLNLAVGADGSIVSDAQSQIASSSKLLLTRLTARGAADPTFAGGTPVGVPFGSGSLMLVHADGSTTLNGQTDGAFAAGTPAPRQLLARYTAAGAPDAAFGSGGIADLGPDITPTQIMPGTGQSVLVVGARTEMSSGPSPKPRRLNIRLVAANGTIDPRLGGPQGHDVNLQFGGGSSSFVVSIRPRPVASLSQNTFGRFGDSQLLRRVDGSYIVAGAVQVSQPTGEGAGFSIGRFAATALTPSFNLDTAFGGPPTPPRLSLRLARQRASTARTRHGIRVVLNASAVGLARVKITHGGRSIAHSLLPVFTTTRRTLPVELTRYGNTYLRHHRNVGVSLTATTRDLLTNTATTSTRGRLR